MKLIRFIIAATLFILMISPAHAYKHPRISTPSNCGFFQPCNKPLFSMPFVLPAAPVHGFIPYTPSTRTEVVEHPSGCPHRAFCGCGAAVHLFGHPVGSLMAAAHWFRFPETAPAPKMAAVRRHHVMILERHISGNMWEVYDANSGHHATRIHAKDISRYRIVNPHIAYRQ